MPLFKTPKGLFFFAHVPRTGGSSVEDYLLQRFGQPAFHDRSFLSKPASIRWSRTTPQHLSADEFETLFPSDFVDHKISVVRHPVSRIVSIFKWLRSTQKGVERDFDKWLEKALSEVQADPWCHDGHLKCQVEFVPSGCQVFRLEEGLERVARYVDSLFDEERPEVVFSHSHKSTIDLKQISSKTGVMPQAGYEIWSELGFTYAKTKVGTMDFTGTAYGLTADNLSLDGGSVEMGNSQVGLSSEAKQSHLYHR